MERKIFLILIILNIVLLNISIPIADSVAHKRNAELEEVNNKFLYPAIIEITSYTSICDDPTPPVTNIYFDSVTGEVTFIALIYPGGTTVGVKATYYKIDSIDSGNFIVYITPFKLPEGTHTVYFYSEDIWGNKEAIKFKTFTFDSMPPTVTITSPEEACIYIFGTPRWYRVSGSPTICIGKVPVTATADDHNGTGVNKVLFSYNDESGWDDTPPYEDVYRGHIFGDLTISVTAIDNFGHESEPVEMTIKCYNLG